MKVIPDRQSQKLIISFLIGVLVGAFSLWMWTATQRELTPDTSMGLQEEVSGDAPMTAKDTTAPALTQIHNDAIVVPNQKAGSTVRVDKVMLQEDGWVVIHEGNQGQIGNALGALRFDAGEHSGVVDLLRATEPNKSYRAILYRDNGDHEFNLDDDFPFLQNGNQPVLATFTTL